MIERLGIDVHFQKLHIGTEMLIFIKACFLECGDTLLLHELLCDRPVDWETLAARLPFRNIRRVEFGFPPDRLGVEFDWETPPEPEHLFLRGGWDLPENFCIPAFAVFLACMMVLIPIV